MDDPCRICGHEKGLKVTISFKNGWRTICVECAYSAAESLTKVLNNWVNNVDRIRKSITPNEKKVFFEDRSKKC
jgi:hypothetical protein